jgi:protein-L-isoaspartate O-methyltransferase
MVATIRELFQLTAPETGVREAPPEVIEALRRVLRHRFIPPQEAALAYMRTCPCPSAWVRLSRSPASSH